MTEDRKEIKLGDHAACKLCAAPFVAEFPYQLMGICGDCVMDAADLFSRAHSGEPVSDFAALKRRKQTDRYHGWLAFERSEFKGRARS